MRERESAPPWSVWLYVAAAAASTIAGWMVATTPQLSSLILSALLLVLIARALWRRSRFAWWAAVVLAAVSVFFGAWRFMSLEEARTARESREELNSYVLPQVIGGALQLLFLFVAPTRRWVTSAQ